MKVTEEELDAACQAYLRGSTETSVSQTGMYCALSAVLDMRVKQRAALTAERNDLEQKWNAADDERERLEEALKWEALEDCSCHCCIQKIERAKKVLGWDVQVSESLARAALAREAQPECSTCHGTGAVHGIVCGCPSTAAQPAATPAPEETHAFKCPHAFKCGPCLVCGKLLSDPLHSRVRPVAPAENDSTEPRITLSWDGDENNKPSDLRVAFEPAPAQQPEGEKK